MSESASTDPFPFELSIEPGWSPLEGSPLDTESLEDDARQAMEVAPLPREGDLLRERFRLIRELGAGRSGIVFLARDEHADRDVALKVLRNDRGLFRFKQEYRRLCDVAHPNVIAALELYAEAFPAFLVMPYVEGRHMDVALAGLPREKCAAATKRAFAQLALALRALHGAGIVHRDVKPSNVLVSAQGVVRLVDFGLASPALSSDGRTIYGTPAYVAPEIVEGHPATPASDWYSFGVMLYQILSDRLPFAGALQEVLERKCREPAPPLARAIHATAPDLAELALALLARDPSDRPHPARVLETLGVTSDELGPSRAASFFGRGRELARLRALYDEAKQGRARALEITGPSGIGKTSLVQAFVDELVASGERPLVLSNVCYENEHGSFHAIEEALAGLGLSPPRAQLREHRVWDDPLATRITEALLDRQSKQPIVLVIDQLQWADADSARVLAEIWPQIEGARLLCLFLTRDDLRHASPFVRYVEAQRPEILDLRWSLGPLELDAQRALVDSLGAGEGIPVQSAHGNPMVLSWMARGSHAPRLLDEEAHELGAWVALAGHPVSLDVLERALGERRDVPSAARRLEAQRWLVRVFFHDRTMLAPSHDWTRAELMRGVPPDRARVIHKELGDALAAFASSTPEEIGEHYYRARDFEALLPHAERAMERARAQRAFASEALWLERLLELDVSGRLDHEALRLRAASAHEEAGQCREAAAHYLAVANGADRERAAELRLRAAEQLFRCGEWDPGYVELHAALAELGVPLPSSTPSLVAGLLWTRIRLRERDLDAPMRRDDQLAPITAMRIRAYGVATLAHLASHPWMGAYCASRHLLLTLRARAGDHLLRALSDELTFAAGARGARAKRDVDLLVRKIRALLPDHPREEDRLYAEMMLGIVPLHAGRFGEASAALLTSERAMRESSRKLGWELTICRRLLLSSEMFHCGLGGSYLETIDAWLAEAKRRRDVAAVRYFLVKRIIALIARDDVDSARAACLEARRSLLGTETSFDVDRATLVNSRALVRLYEARAFDTEARVLVRELERVMRSPVGRIRGMYTTAAFLLGALLLLERPTVADPTAIDRRVARLERRLLANEADHSDGWAHVLAAAITHAHGRAELAIVRLDEAIAAFARAGMRPAAAAACVRRAQLLGKHDDLVAAYDALEGLGIRAPARYVHLHAPGFQELVDP